MYSDIFLVNIGKRLVERKILHLEVYCYRIKHEIINLSSSKAMFRVKRKKLLYMNALLHI